MDRNDFLQSLHNVENLTYMKITSVVVEEVQAFSAIHICRKTKKGVLRITCNFGLRFLGFHM